MTLIKSISGIRGTIGGPTGDTLNPLDIVKFTTAYAKFIRQSDPTGSNCIVVGRDARISGDMVRLVVCGTLIGMGYDVLDIGLATTPTTELAVRMSHAAGGIIVTASHNPKEYNGYKVYWEDGAQLPPKHADEVAKKMKELDVFDCVKTMDYDQAVAQGRITLMGAETDEKFLANVMEQVNDKAVVEQMRMVSINTESICTSPCLTGCVASAAAAAFGTAPIPASFEKSPRLMPVMTIMPNVAP